MPVPLDFLSVPWRKADWYLTQLRKKYNDEHEGAARIASEDVVLLATLDGAGAHHAKHPGFPASHYLDFAEICRRLMRNRGGKVLAADPESEVSPLACGWFPANGQAGACAAKAIRDHFVEIALNYTGDWQHKRHALAALGQSEYSAFRLLQRATRDQVVIDPSLWKSFDGHFRDSLESSAVAPPNFAIRSQHIQAMVEETIEAARTRLSELILEAQIPQDSENTEPAMSR